MARSDHYFIKLHTYEEIAATLKARMSKITSLDSFIKMVTSDTRRH